MKGKISKIAAFLPREAIIWSMALILLALYQPGGESHFSFCVFHHLGIEWCPGCGLGRSIAWLLKGQIEASIHSHPLGIVAVAVLLHRIFFLCYQCFYYNNTSQNGENFRNTP